MGSNVPEQLEKKCKDLEFEVGCHSRRASRQGDLESQLRESRAVLGLAEGRAADLVTRLAERESASTTLELRLKVARVDAESEGCARSVS